MYCPTTGASGEGFQDLHFRITLHAGAAEVFGFWRWHDWTLDGCSKPSLRAKLGGEPLVERYGEPVTWSFDTTTVFGELVRSGACRLSSADNRAVTAHLLTTAGRPCDLGSNTRSNKGDVAMGELTAVDVLIQRAVRDGVMERATPHVPVNVLGVECDRQQLTTSSHVACCGWTTATRRR